MRELGHVGGSEGERGVKCWCCWWLREEEWVLELMVVTGQGVVCSDGPCTLFCQCITESPVGDEAIPPANHKPKGDILISCLVSIFVIVYPSDPPSSFNEAKLLKIPNSNILSTTAYSPANSLFSTKRGGAFIISDTVH